MRPTGDRPHPREERSIALNRLRPISSPISALLAIALTAMFLGGCGKDSPVDPPKRSRSQLLTSSPWKITRVTGPGSTDLTAQIPLSRLSFLADGTYDMIAQKGTWQFANLETQIIFDRGLASESVGDVADLTENALTIVFQKSPTDLPTPFTVQFVKAPALDRSPVVNFETLWSEFDSRYSFFVVKNINWDSLHLAYKSLVTSSTTDQQLHNILTSLLDNLRDGHVNLLSPYGRYNYLINHSVYHLNFLGPGVVAGYTLNGLQTYAGGTLRFGRIGNDIGYLYVGPNFTGDASAWTSGIDAVMDSCALLQRMVVDVRGNSGGNDQLASIVAGRFMDQSRLFSYIQWRTGPLHTDMSAYIPLSIGPAGVRRFGGRVVLLTNRQCYSSAEEFILMMKARLDVTVMGDVSGGGSGNPITLELPNGWQYTVSRWIQYTADKSLFEEVGLAPDIPAAISPADSVAGHDTVLERAVAQLRL